MFPIDATALRTLSSWSTQRVFSRCTKLEAFERPHRVHPRFGEPERSCLCRSKRLEGECRPQGHTPSMAKLTCGYVVNVVDGNSLSWFRPNFNMARERGAVRSSVTTTVRGWQPTKAFIAWSTVRTARVYDPIDERTLGARPPFHPRLMSTTAPPRPVRPEGRDWRSDGSEANVHHPIALHTVNCCFNGQDNFVSDAVDQLHNGTG